MVEGCKVRKRLYLQSKGWRVGGRRRIRTWAGRVKYWRWGKRSRRGGRVGIGRRKWIKWGRDIESECIFCKLDFKCLSLIILFYGARLGL